jgi:hypothetical protein
MRSTRRAGSLGVAMSALLIVTACGSDVGDRQAGRAGTIPITQRAIAAVALEHVSTSTTSRAATYTDNHDPKGALGADLRYGGDGENDGDLLSIFVSPRVTQRPCDDENLDGCTSRKVAGGKLVLTWVKEEPEEDPGYVEVSMIRGGHEISVGWYGDTIKGDPRNQHLKFSVRKLEEVAQDNRLDLTTSQQAIDAGKSLAHWKGGEPDPTAYDRVPATDASLINSYWSAHGGYGAFHHRGSSPLKSDLGADAIGGRFTSEKTDGPAQTIDVLAARRPPAWLAAKPCATKRFIGHCRAYDSKRGPRYFAWTPGTRGAVWMFQQRKGEFVAIRKSGFDVSEKRTTAEVQSDWYFVDSYLENHNFGLQTDKEMLDTDFG